VDHSLELNNCGIPRTKSFDSQEQKFPTLHKSNLGERDSMPNNPRIFSNWNLCMDGASHDPRFVGTNSTNAQALSLFE
jgi:hypothetical protein